ncbi:MAG TPA: hypothetical protein VGN57_15475 [Pirellulaceae bacterium]|jgi:glutamate-ammonia-ligase adenylyltransferase|nr:hypothetical protein [Pirellulaceae bacterium]
MDVLTLRDLLDRPIERGDWFRAAGLSDVERASRNLAGMAEAGIPLDLLAVIADQLAAALPHAGDAHQALDRLETFVRNARSPLALAALFERDPTAVEECVFVCGASARLGEILATDPESYDLLRLTEGLPVAREALIADLTSEVDALHDERDIAASLRRFERRETLRIAYGDLVRGLPQQVVARQNAYVADAVLEAALRSVRKKLEASRGVPRLSDGRAAGFVALAMGNLGGSELDYSQEIELVFLYEGDGQTDGPRRTSNAEFFERLASALLKLLVEPTEFGKGYRVDLRQRPNGIAGPIVHSVDQAYRYYDLQGRTWERQAYVKARPAAGSTDLGQAFLARLAPWVYRRYLSRADVSGIKALKRKIELRAEREGGAPRDPMLCRGGALDVEFAVQFLQLLNGGELEEIRVASLLEALDALARTGCVTEQERSQLASGYDFLRTIAHRLQLTFDRETKALPDDPTELARIAKLVGSRGEAAAFDVEQFDARFAQATTENRAILDRLLREAFADDQPVDPAVDLVFDPHPAATFVEQALAAYGFRDVQSAYANLVALSHERNPFLSTRRCRHFLASIVTPLLTAISQSPDPDATLVNLARVSESLGGKGVLWELFNFNPATLELYVRLCGSSDYLSGILTSSPGMIDELLDSLLLDRLPTREGLRRELEELTRNAEDPEPILHSFKNMHHLNIGVRDVLGKEDLQATHRALADVAEVCLERLIAIERRRTEERLGVPTIVDDEGGSRRCELFVLGLGKLGAREPNYHSDLDVLFLYEGDGTTRHRNPSRQTTNRHFFSELAQRIVKVCNERGPYGRLFDLDARHGPAGREGPLAVSLEDFSRHFAEENAPLRERQALLKARVIAGPAEWREGVAILVEEAVRGVPWRREFAESIRLLRYRMEENATDRNLKRGSGGTVDIEFAVQMLQLKAAEERPESLVPGTLEAIEALKSAGSLADDLARTLAENYRFLRTVESCLRLMNASARHDLPQDEGELKRLAYLLREPDEAALAERCARVRAQNRELFEAIFAEECGEHATA